MDISSLSAVAALDPAVTGLLASNPVAVSQIHYSALPGRLPQTHGVLHRPEKPPHAQIFLPCASVAALARPPCSSVPATMKCSRLVYAVQHSRL